MFHILENPLKPFIDLFLTNIPKPRHGLKSKTGDIHNGIDDLSIKLKSSRALKTVKTYQSSLKK